MSIIHALNQRSERLLWTSRDEAALAELTARREQVMSAARDALRSAMSEIFDGSLSQPEFEDIIKYMTINATAVRAALLPFDDTARK